MKIVYGSKSNGSKSRIRSSNYQKSFFHGTLWSYGKNETTYTSRLSSSEIQQSIGSTTSSSSLMKKKKKQFVYFRIMYLIWFSFIFSSLIHQMLFFLLEVFFLCVWSDIRFLSFHTIVKIIETRFHFCYSRMYMIFIIS